MFIFYLNCQESETINNEVGKQFDMNACKVTSQLMFCNIHVTYISVYGVIKLKDLILRLLSYACKLNGLLNLW